MTLAVDATYITSCSEVGTIGGRLIRYEPEGAESYSGEVPTNMRTFEMTVIATGRGFERLSWIDEAAAKAGATTPFLKTELITAAE